MTDNPEQVAGGWSQKQAFDNTNWSYKWYFFALGMVFLAFAVTFAVLITLHARSHNVLWLINGLNRLLAISLACVSLWSGYRRVKTTAVGSWPPGQLLLFIKSTFTLMFVQTAMALTVLFISFLIH